MKTERRSVVPGLGEQRLMGTGFLSVVLKCSNTWSWLHSAQVKNHRTIQFKSVNCMVYKICLHKTVKKKT